MIIGAFATRKTRRWRYAAATILALLLQANSAAAVSCKCDHVSARAFGAEGSQAWGLLANDTVALNPFGTVSALEDLGPGKVDIAFSARGDAAPVAKSASRNPARVSQNTRSEAKLEFC